jgi:uncharacterized oligopeptide transporter (OPT) family protein
MSAKSGASSEDGKSGEMLILLAGTIIGFIVAFLRSNGNIMMAIIGGIVSLILSFLFVIVAGRLAGTIGTSNLPVSGMTIASLVVLTLVFVSMGWKSQADNKSLLLIAVAIFSAISPLTFTYL